MYADCKAVTKTNLLSNITLVSAEVNCLGSPSPSEVLEPRKFVTSSHVSNQML